MTDDRLPLAELMAKTGDGDFLRTIAENVLQIIMEADVDGLVGAGRHERSGDRTTWRNGYRDRSLDTRLGTLNLKIPKLRTGAYFPGFLEPRKTVEKALVAVIQEAWIAGVSTRRVDELVQAMGMTGISKSSVSKLCKDIDERVHAFLKRPLAGDWPYRQQNSLAAALREIGRIERTLFTLRWFEDPALRRTVTAELNKGEARNSLARAVAFHRLGRFRDRGLENQQTRAAALNLVTAAIILFNCRYLGRAVDEMRRRGSPIDPAMLSRLSPLGWDRINLTGDYVWSDPLALDATASCRGSSNRDPESVS